MGIVALEMVRPTAAKTDKAWIRMTKSWTSNERKEHKWAPQKLIPRLSTLFILVPPQTNGDSLLFSVSRSWGTERARSERVVYHKSSCSMSAIKRDRKVKYRDWPVKI